MTSDNSLLSLSAMTQRSPQQQWQALRSGGKETLAAWFVKCRERLERLVSNRLDRRLLGRVDPADVVQEAYLEIARRTESFVAAPAVSPFVWFRQITVQTLVDMQRRHLSQKRNAGQDISLESHTSESAAFSSLTWRLPSKQRTPSQVAMRNECGSLIQRAVGRLDEMDREIITLRHMKQLSNSDAAKQLGISTKAASNRHARALRRLRDVLDERKQ